MLRVADLCAGTGSATEYFVQRGHTVHRFDLPDGDVTKLSFPRGAYDFIWASPPCTEYCKLRLPWYPEPKSVDLGVWEHCLRLIEQSGARYWIIENVLGARLVWGRPDHVCGAFNLWGRMPEWPAGHFWKMRSKMSSRRRARDSAMIPAVLARQVADIIEEAYGYR